MSEPIRGHVAKLFNSRQLALNLGTKDGVVTGMQFDILDPDYADILDPVTGEILGSIDQAKVRVRVTRVQDRLCLAVTGVKGQVNVGGAGTSVVDLGRLFASPRWITEYERLDKRPEGAEPIKLEDSYVQVGDPVVQVVETPEGSEAEAGEGIARSEVITAAEKE